MLRQALAFLWAAISIVTAYAQPTCGTPSPTSEQTRLHEEKFREFVMKAKGASQARTQATNVAVKVWIVRPVVGNAFDIIPHLKNIFDILNEHFSYIGVQFAQIDSPSIVNDNGYFNVWNTVDAISNGIWKKYHYDNSINLYFVGSLCDYSTQSCPVFSETNVKYTDGIAPAQWHILTNENRYNWITISTSDLRDKSGEVFSRNLTRKIFHTIPHEFGHYFNLYHTHHIKNANSIEKVDGSNCIDGGDEICDTPADPGLTDLCYLNPTSECYDIYRGVFSSRYKEPNTGKEYKPMYWNMMGYYSMEKYYFEEVDGFKKVPQFTPGQFQRMANGFLWRKANINLPSLRYYIDGQKHLAVEKLMSANDTARVSQFCAGATARVSAFWYGRVDRIQYNLQVVSESTGAVAAEFNDLYLNQYNEGGQYLTGGSIRFTLPVGLAAGRYRLRVRNLYEGVSDTSQPFNVLATPYNIHLTLAGAATIQEGETTSLTLNFSGGLPATYSISPGFDGNVISLPHTITVQPARSTTYRIQRVRNGCGESEVPIDSVRITVIPITGVEPPLSAGVRVYPNPARESVTVEVSNSRGARIELLELTGRAVVSTIDVEKSVLVNLSNCPAGMYLLRIQQGETFNTYKLIKR